MKPEEIDNDLPEDLKKSVFLTTVDNVYNWGRAALCGP